jgi:hypothetical protein
MAFEIASVHSVGYLSISHDESTPSMVGVEDRTEFAGNRNRFV